MLTWLDHHISYIEANALHAYRNVAVAGRTEPSPLRTALVSITVGTLQSSEHVKINKDGTLSSIDRIGMIRAAQLLTILPILNPIGYEPLCLQATPKLAEEFYRKKTDEFDEFEDIVKKHHVIYIDLPHGKFLVGDEYEIRAIVVLEDSFTIIPDGMGPDGLKFRQRHRDSNQSLIFSAILTKKNSDTVMTHILWGQNNLSGGLGVTVPDLDVALLQQQVKELAKIIVLYFMVAPNGSQEIILPTERTLERKERRIYERTKPYTFFKTVKIGLVEHATFDVGPRTNPPRSGWKLGEKIDVEGYYQKKWKGPKGKQYCEVIYVGSHTRGPDDGERKVRLYEMNPSK